MKDEITVQCICSREFVAPAKAVGQTIACPNCGRPVRVTAENVIATSDGADEGQSTPAPVPPEPPRQLSQAELDVSLFLDDDEDPAPRSQRAPATSTVQPPRGAAATVGAVSPKPPPPAPVSAQGNATRAAEPDYSPFVPKGQRAEAKVPRCARCNRPFRGPWDQIDTDEGTLCNICARHIDNIVPGSAPPGPPAAAFGEQSELYKEMARQQSWHMPAVEQAVESARQDDAHRQHIQMAIFAGVAVLTLVLILVWPESAPRPAAPVQEPRELPQAYAYTIVAINALLHIATYAIAIYCMLLMAKRLPNHSLFANIAAVTVVAVLVWAANFMPFAGFIIGAVIIYRFYELSVGQFVMLWIFLILADMLARALGALIFGIRGMIAL